jgi:hypothetical protein
VSGEAGDLSATSAGTACKPTGDDAVDEVLGLLDLATGQHLDIQIEASERVYRVLQGRLADLGQE